MNKDTFTKYTRIKSYVDPGIDRRHYVQHNHGSVRDVPIGRQRGCTFEFGTRCIYSPIYSCPGVSFSGYVNVYIYVFVCLCLYMSICYPLF